MVLVWKEREKPKDDIINNVKKFDLSRMEEIESLLNNDTFRLVNVHTIIEQARIFWSILNGTVKTVNYGVK